MSESAPAAGNPDPESTPELAPAEEADYQQALALLRDPPPSQQKTQLLLISLVAFVAATFAQDTVESLVELAMLIGVLFVHELGHVVGMRVFGYRDIRMFFIPFFGAAAAGHKRGVPRWQQGVVLLLGPVPGIVIGVILAQVAGPPELRTLALMFIVVNAINLLPIAQLDGGQLFQIMLFSRHRHLEVSFLAVTASLVIVAGILGSLWFVAIIGGFMLMGVPHRKRVLAVATELRDLPADPGELTDAQGRRLYRAMWNSLPPQWQQQWRGKPRPQAQVMEDILERVTQVAPDANASVSLGAAWLVAIFVALVGASTAVPDATDPTNPALGVTSAEAAEWRVVEHVDPEFSIEMPAQPTEERDQDGGGGLIAQVGAFEVYVISWRRVDGAQWLATQNESMLGGGRVISDLRVDEHERRSVVEREGGIVQVARLVVGGELGYTIVALASGEHPDARRFIESFRSLRAK